ncbi:hypothetical protein DFH09DRAFT_1144003 [Mycena vulgaris]|nr:hypothetical protein DFH09DRAFT_1144003 [Mycena vulgaris]
MFIESTFSSKLDTNYVPSDAEVEEIQTALTEPFRQLSLLDERIAQLQAAVNELLAERATLKDEIDRYRALISPVRRIPQDVLEGIFFACLPTHHNSLINAREAPLLLGHICSYWRCVAHSMPTLWASLHIPYINPSFASVSAPPDLIPRFVDVTQAWLARSGTSPVSLSVAYSDIHPVLKQPLQPVFRRLRHLEVEVGTGMHQSMGQFWGAADEFPALESLKIHGGEYCDPMFWTTVGLLNVFALRRVSLRLPVNPMTLPLLWGELTELDLKCYMTWAPNTGGWRGGLGMHDVLDILRRCEKLVKCRLHVTRMDAFEGRASAAVPHLQSLTISEVLDAPGMLDCLHLPRLRHLALDLFPDASCDKNHFLRAVTRHTDFLTSVSFTTQLFSAATLLGFLRLVPSLRELRLRRILQLDPDQEKTQIDDAILQQLTPTPADPGLCPLLTDLELERCALFSDDVLAGFITARMRSPHPLEWVTVDFDRAAQRDIGPELEPFTAEGALHLCLEYYSPLKPWKYNPRDGLSGITTSEY